MNESLQPGAGRWKLVALAALFAAPVVLATLLYTLDWRPRGAVNYGELVQPPRPVADIDLRTPDGKPWRSGELREKWHMVYFAPPECAEACAQNLYKMRQVHVAQGQERDRVERVMVLTGTGSPAWLASVMEEYPDLRVVTGTEANIRALAQQFALPQGSPLDRLERIYVVDPIGNFMMSYPAEADPARVRKDLKHLLKVSQIG